ncbi:MAG: hypothetical protein M3N16_05725, partial [Actinomycetota bacterium]|nr:hypothetical protein [Actinomycetota bacterium]
GEGAARSPTGRQRLADRFVGCRALEGATTREVRRLLGRPDGYVAPWSYDLGPERGWVSIDNEHLVIDFDRARGVHRLHLTTD